ncbi:MAG: type II secretion system F family protein [Candidatus Micrarchaeia archaeon]
MVEEKSRVLVPATSKTTAEADRKIKRVGVRYSKAIINMLTLRFPELKKQLAQAGINKTPQEYISYAILQSAILALTVLVVVFIVTDRMGFPIHPAFLTFVVFPVVMVLFFFYTLQLPIVKIKRRMKEVDRELVFAGKQMLIELKAGVPLFDAMLSISRGYGEASKEFNKIVEKISMGVPADVAMQQVSELNPSPAFRRIVMQLINSLRSGADVAEALESVLDQLSREQIIEIKRYGQKLNPLAMFYMLFGIIMPSLGVTLFIIITSFVSIKLTFDMLMALTALFAILQWFFLTMIESSRPDYYVIA